MLIYMIMSIFSKQSKHNFLQVESHHARTPSWQYFVGVFGVLGIVLGLSFYTLGASSLGGSVADIHEDAQQVFAQAEGIIGGDQIYEQPVVPPPPPLPELIGELPLAEDFSAASILVKDVESGVILFEKNAYEVRPIASLTKLMSALVLLERDVDWTLTTQVVEDELIDTHMYAGDTYTYDELWSSALVGSSNKAIMTLSDAIGWNREAFVTRMNQRAAELGMGSTVFTEPTGLDAANQSSASDLAMLLDASLAQQKIVEGLLGEDVTLYSKEREKEHHMWNTNWLLLGWIPSQFERIVGGKTGYIPAAGYNYMMQVEAAPGKMISVVVLGATSHEARFTEARDAVNAVVEAYQWPEDVVEEEAIDVS